MALFQCSFFSESLGLCCAMDVILPQCLAGTAPPAEGYPTLYLLHGLSDDHTIWRRRTSVERYVADLPLAVVMPAGFRSFYTNMAHGPKCFTFFSEELPRLAQSFFRLSPRREDTFVAGLSMGGYGAFKLALTCPERYAAAASFSGAVDIAGLRRREPALCEFGTVFGDPVELAGGPHDLLHLASQLVARRTVPPALYQSCGTDDFLYPDNLVFRDHVRKLGLPLTWVETPGVGHSWDYWDAQIQQVLKWLPLRGRR